MFRSAIVAIFEEVFFEVHITKRLWIYFELVLMFFVIYPSADTSLKMATIYGPNMEAYDVYRIITSYMFMWPLGRPRRRWVDNIRMDLQEVGCGYIDWIGLTQDRDRWRTLVSAVMNLRVPWNAGNFLTSYKPASFSRRTLHHEVSK